MPGLECQEGQHWKAGQERRIAAMASAQVTRICHLQIETYKHLVAHRKAPPDMIRRNEPKGRVRPQAAAPPPEGAALPPLGGMSLRERRGPASAVALPLLLLLLLLACGKVRRRRQTVKPPGDGCGRKEGGAGAERGAEGGAGLARAGRRQAGKTGSGCRLARRPRNPPDRRAAPLPRYVLLPAAAPAAAPRRRCCTPPFGTMLLNRRWGELGGTPSASSMPPNAAPAAEALGPAESRASPLAWSPYTSNEALSRSCRQTRHMAWRPKTSLQKAGSGSRAAGSGRKQRGGGSREEEGMAGTTCSPLPGPSNAHQTWPGGWPSPAVARAAPRPPPPPAAARACGPSDSLAPSGVATARLRGRAGLRGELGGQASGRQCRRRTAPAGRTWRAPVAGLLDLLHRQHGLVAVHRRQAASHGHYASRARGRLILHGYSCGIAGLESLGGGALRATVDKLGAATQNVGRALQHVRSLARLRTAHSGATEVGCTLSVHTGRLP